MNKIILVIFSVALFMLFYQFIIEKKSKPNNLEQIMSILPNPEKYFKPNEIVYLISSPSNDEIFNKTQFALAPICITRSQKYLPVISSILIIKDLKSENDFIQTDMLPKELDTVFTTSDSNFSVVILKTK